MILNRMELENIRSYKKAEVEFAPGIILFQGDIGSGKSSLLLALEFALFGGTQQHFYDKILRHGEDSAWVSLDFTVDDVEYTAYRSIRRTSAGIQPHECHLDVGDSRMELSWREMRERIDALLKLREGSGFKVETFHMGIYIPQEKMNEILSINDDQRLTSIRRVFNLEDYKRAVDNISILSRELKTEITRLETKAEVLEDSRAELERSKKEEIEKRSELEDSEVELKNITKELDVLGERLRELSELNEERLFLENEKKNLDSRLIRLNRELEMAVTRMEELEQDESRLEGLKEKNHEYERLKSRAEEVKGEVRRREGMERKKDALVTRLEVERERLEELKARRERKDVLEEEIRRKEGIRQEIEGLRAEREGLEKKRTELLGEIRSLEKGISSLLQEKKEIRELEDEAECPKCKQPISGEHVSVIMGDIDNRVKESKDQVDKLSSEANEIRDVLKEIQHRIDRLTGEERDLYSKEKELEQMRGMEEEIREMEKNHSGRIKEIEALEKELESFEHTSDDLDEMGSLMDELVRYRDEYIALVEKLKKRGELESTMEKAEESMADTRKTLDEVVKKQCEIQEKFSETVYQETREKHQAAIGMESKLKERIHNMRSSLENIGRNIEALEERLREMEDHRTKARRFKVLKSWIEGPFKESIRTMEEHRMMQINRQFEHYFRSWFNEILDDPEKYAYLDDKLAPIISTANHVTRVEDLSGGERTSVALAYRLAFNTMIKELQGLESNLLILDEPTMGFSREQLTRLKDVLDKTNADQIIIVSHENEITNLAELEYSVQKVDGSSTVQRV